MDKETGFPEPGDELTIDGQMITIGGQITHNKGDKVIVEAVGIQEGHWYRPLPDIWIKSRLQWVKIQGEYGHWLPGAFEETKNLKS